MAVARIRPPAARATEVRRRAAGDGDGDGEAEEEEEEDPRRKEKIGPRARRPLGCRRQPEMSPHGVARTFRVFGEGGGGSGGGGWVCMGRKMKAERGGLCVFCACLS